MDINSIVVAGRVVHDIEVKYTQSGFAYAIISIASNYAQKKADGSFEQKVNFFDIKILGDKAKNLEKWLKRGRTIIVKGQLRQERWTDQSGQEKSKIGIVSDDIQVLFTEQDNKKPAQSNNAPVDDIPF